MTLSRARALLLACALASPAYAPWEGPAVSKRLVLDVNFETAKDYDITSAYAVRGWNTTEGHMRITCPSPAAKHGGRFGMSVLIDRAFTKNFHAQFSLPHFMTRLQHSGYQLAFWAKLTRSSGREVVMEVVFLDVDEGYEWIGGAEIGLTSTWQHFAMEPGASASPRHTCAPAGTAECMRRAPTACRESQRLVAHPLPLPAPVSTAACRPQCTRLPRSAATRSRSPF